MSSWGTKLPMMVHDVEAQLVEALPSSRGAKRRQGVVERFAAAFDETVGVHGPGRRSECGFDIRAGCGRARLPAMPRIRPLRVGTTVISPITRSRYTVREELGRGGFGIAYRAQTGRRRQVCLKITNDSVSWHREAYMAELLRGHPRVVQVREAFPILRRGHVRYAVAMELAEGTVADLVEGNPMRQRRVIAQTAGLLTALARLHDSGAVHRDITPYNVFVCPPNETLKLGDFGIARHGFNRRPVRADAFAPWFVDTDLYRGSQTRWSISDDLWQLGQLAAVLLTGVVRPIATREVRDLPCGDSVKYAIRRAIGEPAYRFSDAAAMSAALRRDTPLSFAPVRTLADKTVVFTGSLGRDLIRQQAVTLATKAGAAVLPNPSGLMDVLVVGETSPNWFAGEAGGVKILQTISLQEQGYPIKMITGNRFRRLVGMV